jgi:hypothetical protein
MGAALLGLGCSGSVRVKSSAEAKAKEPDPFAALDDPEPTPEPPAAKSKSSGTGPATLVLLGARHDLDLKPHNEPSCSCMAFAVGKPTDQRFVWEGPPPTLSGPNGSAVAFAMVEGECETGLSASYRGYEVSGNDIHILLEVAADGRPQLRGAILPKPQPGGAYVVVPPKDAPFGRSRTPGEAQCTLSEGKVAPSVTTPTRATTLDGGASGTSTLTVRRLQPTEQREDLPTAEEFSETPSDIRDDSFEAERSARNGFHLNFLLGAEYPIFSQISLDSSIDPAMLSGLGFGLDIAIGGNIIPDLAIGVMVGGATAPNPSLDVGSDIATIAEAGEQSGWDVDDGSLVLNGTSANIFRIGAFLDYYFTPNTNWHGLVALGYSSVSFTGGAIGDSPSGFAAIAGVGYDVWMSYHWSLGVIARVQWSPLGSSELDGIVHLISPHLGLTATFH